MKTYMRFFAHTEGSSRDSRQIETSWPNTAEENET
jgi:hypothetical protein